MAGKPIVRGAIGALGLALMLLALPAVPRAAEPAPVPIDVVLPLTGAAAFLGEQEHLALQLGEKVINQSGGIRNRPVKFTFYDDASNPQLGVQLVNSIIASGRQVFLGPGLAAVCGGVVPIVNKGPVDYCLSPAIHPDPGSYVFTADVSSTDTFAALIRYFRLRGMTRVGLMTSTDTTGQDADRGVVDVLKQPENASVQLVAASHFNLSDISVAAQVAQQQAANPQVILVVTTGTALGTVLRNMSQAGSTIPVATTYGNMTFAQMNGYAAFLPRELYFPSSEWPPHGPDLKLDRGVEAALTKFHGALKSAGIALDVAPSLVWDPMMIVVSALQKLGPDAKADQIREYIAHLRGYAGVNGVYDFVKAPQRGLTEDDVVVTRWNAADKTWDIMSRPTGIPLKR